MAWFAFVPVFANTAGTKWNLYGPHRDEESAIDEALDAHPDSYPITREYDTTSRVDAFIQWKLETGN